MEYKRNKTALLHVRCPTSVPIRSHMSPVHALPFKDHFNTILSPTSRSPNYSLSLEFHSKNYARFSSQPQCLVPRPTHPPAFHRPNISNSTTHEASHMQFSPASYSSSSSSSSSPRGQNKFISSLFSNFSGLCASPHATDQVSQPYEKRDKITTVYSLVFAFSDSQSQDVSAEKNLNLISALQIPAIQTSACQ